ncbi:mitochondrial RNA binding protein [Perkinsela sp. CCAP 1560/4]|nr:mitochondrial RNA binding protein [Perkinsela sp. CCAP 1560/4]|eukprot:KNH06305.1 mitochondrial RNA binding protein [Perkinsela sp. CCAP 1560/4]
MLRNTFLKLRTIPRRARSSAILPLQYAPEQMMLPKLFSTSACAYCTANTEVNAKNKDAPSSKKKEPAFMPRGAATCVWNHIHETDASQGKFLRVYYYSGSAHFQFFPQEKTRNELRANTEAREDGSHPNAPAIALCDTTKRVQFDLPTPFMCRLLAVLDGTITSTELVTRNNHATFSGDHQTYKFEISCNSTLPDGKSMSWKFDFTPGESIVLQRFLTLALEKNYGFARYRDRSAHQSQKKRQ